MKSLKTLLLLALIVLFSGILRILGTDDYEIDMASTYFLLSIAVFFWFYVDWVIVQGLFKQKLLLCTGMMILLMVLRGARYGIFREMDQLMRYLWYAYYIPLLLIPYYSLSAAVCIGLTEKEKEPCWLILPKAVCWFLILLILTNDYHQTAFRLHEGYQVFWRDEYVRGISYYLTFAWIFALQSAAFVLILIKCRISGLRRYLWIPMLPQLLGGVWLAMIASNRVTGHLPVEFPETFCFMVAGVWICCIVIGIVPANSSYEGLFHSSSLGALIADHDGKIIYQSRESGFYDPACPESLPEDENLEIRKQDIRGGSVYWQTDVSALNHMTRELESVQQQLTEEAELIRLENELREQRAAIDAKSHVYDATAVRVLPQSRKISELSAHAAVEGELQKSALRKICVYGSYIKRMANLMLLAAQAERISAMELALAFAESLRQLSRMNIATSIYTGEELAFFSAEAITDAYEVFETYVEHALSGLNGIFVTLSGNTVKLTLEGSFADYPEGFSNVVTEFDEDTLFVQILLT